jgi:hypothetical protein
MAKTKKEKTPVDTIKDTCKLLKTMGVTRVTCTYDGSGDSGDVQDITFVSGEPNLPIGEHSSKSLYSFVSQHGSNAEPGKQLFTQTMADALENALWKLVSDNFAGWENNDGAYGEIDVTVENGKITLEHNQRYTEVNTYERDF